MDIDKATCPRLSLVVAAAENGVIGREGDLPWRLPADLGRFKRLTIGHPIVMGRKTYESIGRPLPGRVSVVLTRNAEWTAGHEAVLVATRLNGAIQAASQAEGVSTDEAFVIGGGEIYRLALPHADRVHLTRVHTTVEGDATFSELDASEWRLASSEKHPADEKNEHDCTFEVWERISDRAAQ
ncbi:Dihydrofolate reductase [Planctomycetes bacterium MalM25]|nr:Dihydrofolate reductase [Planctomycetes bacterium MalM25]